MLIDDFIKRIIEIDIAKKAVHIGLIKIIVAQAQTMIVFRIQSRIALINIQRVGIVANRLQLVNTWLAHVRIIIQTHALAARKFVAKTGGWKEISKGIGLGFRIFCHV